MIKLHLNFSIKLFIYTTLLTLLSIIFISISSYNKYSTSIMEQSSEKVQQIVELTALNIQTYLEDLYRLSLSPYYNQDVMYALDKDIEDSNLKSLYRSRTIEDFLEEILIIPRSDIIRVFILTDNVYKGERISSTINIDQDFSQYSWYQEALNKKQPIFVSAHLEQIIKDPKNIVFSIVSVIKSTQNTDKILGIIKVDANYSGISDICNQANLGKDGGLFIIDSNNQIIFSNIPDLTDEDCVNIYNEKSNQQLNTVTLNNTEYLINESIIEYADWHILGVTSLATINKKIIQVRNNAFLFALICFLLSLIVTTIFLYMFLKPLNNIIQNIHKIQSGDFNITFPVKSNDEIGYLSNSLNNMVKELKKMFNENNKLIHQIYEAKYLQKEAQINSLFSQIQPHFIYNTLNLISMLIQSNQLKNAVININKLSIFLRGLTHLNKEITISTELELLDSYLTIQKNRYIDRLNYFINIDESIKNYIIPALLLQPIVENSVVHGCESKKEATTIWITSEIKENYIELIIKDNGIGMTEDTLKNIRQKLNEKELLSNFDLNKKGSGIALINVNKRIKIKYGLEYGLQINSQKDIGTTVKIILPKLETPLKEDGNV